MTVASFLFDLSALISERRPQRRPWVGRLDTNFINIQHFTTMVRGKNITENIGPSWK